MKGINPSVLPWRLSISYYREYNSMLAAMHVCHRQHLFRLKRQLMNSSLWGLHPFVQAALGGVMIGFASWLLLASLGRVAGITGILGGALAPFNGVPKDERAWRWAFVLGLIGMGAIAAFMLNTPTLPTPRPFPLLILAGLLVGFGTVLGSGCTSGHGVCGIGRRSVRSIVATMVFMGAGIVTVTLVKLLTA